MKRYLESWVQRDLKKKMVFLGGPRQCGKTTLAKNVLVESNSGLYLNWDSTEDRSDILGRRWSEKDELLIFDELHKYPKWKNWIKGVFDTQRQQHSFLLTGSARLDVYRRGGDSLLGRYHYWRLHPLTLSELPKGITPKTALDRLMTVGGFPEPFLDCDEREARRWRRERMDRVIRDDVRDLEHVRDIQMLSLLVELLRTRVGGLVVASNLGRDLQVAPKTIKKWLEVLDKMYVTFQVFPLTSGVARAILKPPKVYFFDNADTEDDPGKRFENLVATHLLKRIHFLEDRDGFRYELRYVRDKEGREVDFAVLKDGKLEELIEVKSGDTEISRSLKYFSERLKPKRAIQIVSEIKRSYTKSGIEVLSAVEALAAPLR